MVSNPNYEAQTLITKKFTTDESDNLRIPLALGLGLHILDHTARHKRRKTLKLERFQCSYLRNYVVDYLEKVLTELLQHYN